MFTSGSHRPAQGRVVLRSTTWSASASPGRPPCPRSAPDEVFLSFLPLYHTFGRYLELLGSIYWRGTYVFAGNPSAETLFALLPKVRPTGFISVPDPLGPAPRERAWSAIDAAPAGADAAAVVRRGRRAAPGAGACRRPAISIPGSSASSRATASSS
ncbi:MAG: AMP-binding protein [Comamonadaceae bacterium]|nr:AMP-binding protein [Comamonadaceae bacterium]